MTLIDTILAALLPIFFVTGLGWLSGKRRWLNADASATLAPFVIKFALPIALFLAAAKADPRAILDLPFAGTLLCGITATLIMGFAFGRHARGNRPGEAAVEGLATSFGNLAYCGPPVLLAVVGTSGLLGIVIGNIILALVLLPAVLLMLARVESGAAGGIGRALRDAVLQPLVILPLAGLVIALSGFHLPVLIFESLDQLGRAAGGVALFTLGLILSGIEPKFDREIVGNVAIKNFAQPALLLGFGWLFGLSGDLLKTAFLLGVLPTATAVPPFAFAHRSYAHNAAETVLASTLTSIVTISLGVVIAGHL